MADILLKGRKGSSASFQQTPDNLRSDDTFEGVLGMGIGPMYGPVNGLKSITLDGTAVENATGDQNFGDFIVTLGTGDPAAFPQPIQLKLGAGGSPTQVGLQLNNTSATAPGPWVTKTLANTNADFIDLRFIVNQLYKQDKSGIYTDTLTIEINMKPTGSTNWINPTLNTPSGKYSSTGINVAGIQGSVVRALIPQDYYDNQGNWLPAPTNYAITGKTSSPSVYELRIGVPNEGNYANTSWDVRCRLIEIASIDADPNFEKRNVSWESMSAVYSKILGTDPDWRGVAWMQLYGKASDQLTGVPEVLSEWKTKIVSVPPSSVYDPNTRQYAGTMWDGSWTKAYTNDPAWVVNDAISDSLSGLSLIAQGSFLNKWDALDASKWCSTLVPDGNGGTQPRYSLNLAITEPQKAEDLIRYMAGAVGGLAWDQGDGQWRMKIDKPEAPVDIFTLESIEGDFMYSNTDVDTRYNDITGSFLNADMDYRQDRVRLYDNTSIALIGRKPTTVALVGCTNRQEAMRRVKLRLRSTVNERRIVNFTTNRRGRNINQLDLILVADGSLGDSSKPTTGRGDTNGTVITFRDPIYLPSGATYDIVYSLPNPSYNPDATSQPGADWTKPTLTVSSRVSADASNYNAAVRQLTVTSAFPANTPASVSFAISSPGLPALPKLYRVTAVNTGDDGERMSISAIEVDQGKWDASDNVSKSDTVFQDLRGQTPPPQPPLNGQLLSLVKVPVNQGYQTNLVANWIRPAGAFINGFKISYRINGGAWQNPQDNLTDTTFELVNPTPGLYEFSIQTQDRLGGLSEPLSAVMNVTQDALNAAQIYYVDPTTKLPTVPVQSLQPSQAGADVTGQNTAKDTNNIGGRATADVLSRIDAANSTVFDTTPPDVPKTPTLSSAVSYAADGKQIVTTTVTWPAVAATDTAGYVVALSTNNGGFVNTDVGNVLSFSTTQVAANTPVAVKVQAYDRNMNYSGFSTTQTSATAKDTIPPAAPTAGSALGSLTSLFLSWTNAADTDLAGVQVFEASVNDSSKATLVNTVNGLPLQPGGYTRSGLPSGSTRYYWLKSVDTSGNTSGFSTGFQGSVGTVSNVDLTPGLIAPSQVNGLPAASGYTGPSLVYNSQDGKLYRYSNGAFTAAVSGSDITTSSIPSSALSASNLSSLTGTEAIKNTQITLDATGAVTGIGTGSGIVVANSQIGLVNGTITGIGAGAGTSVANSLVSIGANGALVGAGGGQVTAGGLGVNGDNIVLNSGLTNGTTGFRALSSNTTLVASSTDSPSAYFFRATGPNDGSFATQIYPVPSGTYMFVSYWRRPSVSGLQSQVGVQFIDSSGLNAGTPASNDFSGVANTWTFVQTLFTIPKNAVSFYVSVTSVTGGSGNVHDATLVRASTAQSGATIGAQTGVNLVDSTGVSLTDSLVKNTAITINNGNLTGIGSGTGTSVANGLISLSSTGVLTGGGSSAQIDALQVLNAPLVAGATKNIVSYSTTAPTNPGNNDIWVDTSVTPNVTRVRVGGAWQIASSYTTNTNQLTDGASLGQTAAWTGVTSRPSNLSALSGSEAIQNTAIAINNGLLNGIGTGTGTAVGNGLISMSAAGQLTGAGTSSAIDALQVLNGPAVAGATKNTVTYSSTAPAYPTNNDIWVDTSVVPNVTRVRVSSAWQIASSYTTNTNQLTDGASLGQTAVWTGVTSRPSNLSALSGSEAIQNTAISISNGNLTGIGTGTGTAVANSGISLSAAGQLTGAGASSAIDALQVLNGPSVAGATKNTVTYSSTAPASPTNNDIWVDTSIVPNVTRVRVGGAWQIASSYTTDTNQLTDSAKLGQTAAWGGVSSRPANLSVLSGSEAIQNSGISISASGALNGAGGGQVSITGLGYLGALNATADMRLTPIGTATINGNTIKSNTSTDGGDGGQTVERILGACQTGCIVSSLGTYMKLVSSGGQYFECNIGGDGNVRCYTTGQGSGYAVIGTGAVGDAFALVQDETKVQIWKNGSVIYTRTDLPTPQQTWYAQFTCYGYATIGGVYFRAFSDKAWASVGGPNKPADNATVGAPTGTKVGGTDAGSIETRANDPAAWINTGGTSTVSGSRITAYSIQSLQIAANAISTNNLVVSSRPFSTIGLDLQILNGVISWNNFYIQYPDNTGNYAAPLISAGTYTGSGNTYIYYVPGNSNLSVGTDPAVTVNPNVIMIATWNGANNLTPAAGVGTLINGARIVTGTITSAQIKSKSITGDNIQAGTITTALLAVGAITADKLAVGAKGQNLVPNPAAADGTVNSWLPSAYPTSYAPNLTANNYFITQGRTGFNLTKNAAGNDQIGVYTTPMKVVPGKTYVIRGTILGTTATSSGLYFEVFGMNSATMTDAASNSAGYVTNLVNNGPVSTAAVPYEFTWTAPAGMAWAALGVYNWSGGPATVNFTDIEFFEQVSTVVIADGAITAVKIQAYSITSQQIQANSISGDRISTTTSLPGTITVGTSGVSIATVQSQANNPAAQVNANTTLINSGMILIAGSSYTLNNWKNGSDNTKIEGGAIAANTIAANTGTFGNRNVQVNGLDFRYDPGSNSLVWSSGDVTYINDAGTGNDGFSLNAGSAVYSGSVMYVWINRNNSTVQVGNNNPGNPNDYQIGRWYGGTNINITFGRTLITNDRIQTGQITADRLNVAALSAITGNVGTLTAGLIISKDGASFLDLSNNRYVFNASQFQITTPGVNTVSPFSYQGGVLTITGANINGGNINGSTITTAQLQDNSVTRMVIVSMGTTVLTGNGFSGNSGSSGSTGSGGAATGSGGGSGRTGATIP